MNSLTVGAARAVSTTSERVGLSTVPAIHLIRKSWPTKPDGPGVRCFAFATNHRASEDQDKRERVVILGSGWGGM